MSSISESGGESDTERQNSKKTVKKAMNIDTVEELEKIRSNIILSIHLLKSDCYAIFILSSVQVLHSTLYGFFISLQGYWVWVQSSWIKLTDDPFQIVPV